MIAACPRCSTRFRIGPERLRDEGVRLRCSGCQAVFRVYPPRAQAPRRRDDPAVEAELTPPPRPPDRERLVLIADPDPARGKASAAAIGRLGLHPLLVSDGVDALLSLQRSLPSRIVIDASLARLGGAELCEVVKRNESLRATRVVVAGSTEALAALTVLRAAGLGPDAMVEYGDLPDALPGALGLARGDESFSAPASAPERRPEAEPAALPSPLPPPRPAPWSPEVVEAEPAPPAAAPLRPPAAAAPPAAASSRSTQAGVSSDPEIARAERLARIVVSDIVLYNAERFERGLRNGDVLEALAGEVAEARKLLRERVPAPLCAERDFVAEELLRVAKTRAAR